MFGLEAIFRNGVPVGHLRRADYGFFIDKTLGYGYIHNPDGGVVSLLHIVFPVYLGLLDLSSLGFWDCSCFHSFILFLLSLLDQSRLIERKT